MIHPCGHRLVIKPFKQEEVDEVLKKARESGFLANFEIVNSNKAREDASVDKGIVLSIGSSCWPNEAPWCKVGDVILFVKHSPKFVEDPETKSMLGILNDEDVVAVIQEGTK